MEAGNSDNLNTWVKGVLAEPKFAEAPAGPWNQGGCLLLALAIHEALAAHCIRPDLVEYIAPGGVTRHVAVAVDQLRVDCCGAWNANARRKALTGWTETQTSKIAILRAWGPVFDDQMFRQNLTARLVATFPEDRIAQETS